MSSISDSDLSSTEWVCLVYDGNWGEACNSTPNLFTWFYCPKAVDYFD